MKRVLLESPFAGNIERNVAYAKLCMKELLLEGMAPIASHLLWTQPGLLDDNNKEQRRLGIAAGHAWLLGAEAAMFYIDFGMSAGMEIGLQRAKELKVPYFFRNLQVRIENQHAVEALKLLYPTVLP